MATSIVPTDLKLSPQLQDRLLLLLLALSAGCGLIYEYLLSHYAGRVLGVMEITIFGIITTMMVAMGLGSFAARQIENPFNGFAWLEVSLALVGATATLLIGGLFALVNLLPQILSDTFGLPRDLLLSGGVFADLQHLVKITPYLVGALLGFLIGIEIPLIGRMRAVIYHDERRNNPGAIYGIDYIGAGLGATLWIGVMLALPVALSAALTAAVNLLLGVLFTALFSPQVRRLGALLLLQGVTGLVILQVASYGSRWDEEMEDLLYKDEVVLRHETRWQRLVVTERQLAPPQLPVTTFYINGRTQFSSRDEVIYHALLTYPALLAAPRHERILVVGGGDGLAVRDLLRWQPQQIVLLDLDPELVALFRDPLERQGRVVNQRLLDLNQRALQDPRVQFRFGDAFITVDGLLQAEERFDLIVVDLPDPSHPDLNKLYSVRFYTKLKQLLQGDGVLAVQSTSPYHAKKTFLSIGKTLNYAGFQAVEPYHANVPSFGEWGWHIATLNGAPASVRIAESPTLPVDDGWTTRELLLAAFVFPRHFFEEVDRVEVNRIGALTAYQYYQHDWEEELGIVPTPLQPPHLTEGERP